MKTLIRLISILGLFFSLIEISFAERDELYFIDAHSQVDHTLAPLTKVISIMQEGDVSHTILSARGKLQGKTLLSFASQYPEQITPAVRTKGKPYEIGSAKYYNTLNAQVTSGKYSAMAEVLIYHAQKGYKAPEYIVTPDDNRVQAALKHATSRHWPFVVHIEFGALAGNRKEQFMQSLEKLLETNPDHPFVLTHMGQLNADECQHLIERYNNIHFHTGWTNPVAVKSSNQPWVNIFAGKQLSTEWEALFIKYPERFVFALDNVFAEHWGNFYLKQMKFWKKALKKLPRNVAQLIAHGNAERLWGIPPKQ